MARKTSVGEGVALAGDGESPGGQWLVGSTVLREAADLGTVILRLAEAAPGPNGETGRPGDVHRQLEVPDRGRGFIPVKVRDAAGGLEVIHPFGCRVRVTDEVNLAMLRQVLDLLDERGSG